MKKTIFLLPLLAFAFSGLASETWSQKMRNLGDAVSDLLPDLYSDSRFADPANKARLEKDIKVLAEMTHGLAAPRDDKALPSDADPTIHLMMSALEGEMTRAYREFKRDNFAYAQYVLKGAIGNCITCHTRTKQGSFNPIPAKIKLEGLSAFERGEYYAATRRFDLALKEYRNVIAFRASKPDDIRQWEKAIEHALAITVRFEADAAKTLKLIKEALESPIANSEFRHSLLAWEEAAVGWKNEPPISEVRPDTLRAKMKELKAQAKAAEKKSGSHGAAIQHWRLSALSHDLLRLGGGPDDAASGLYEAGLAHQVLWEGPPFFMPEMYFEACIRTAPHTEISRQCFTAYKNTLTRNYTGSAGFNLPEGADEQMKVLKKLAY